MKSTLFSWSEDCANTVLKTNGLYQSHFLNHGEDKKVGTFFSYALATYFKWVIDFENDSYFLKYVVISQLSSFK